MSVTETSTEVEAPVRRGRGRPRKERPEDNIVVSNAHEFPKFDTYKLSAILEECIHSSNAALTTAFLQEHMTVALSDILRIVYDPAVRLNTVSFEIPGRNGLQAGWMPLLKIMQNRMRMFLRTKENDAISTDIREREFLKQFEEVRQEDYLTLTRIFQKKAFPGITQEIAEAALNTKF